MMLNTKARYAVMGMVYIATYGDKKAISLAEISNSQSIPLTYLEQIFMCLKKANLVIAVRGPGGGYKLADAKQNIRISAIIDAVDESIKMTRCSSSSHSGCTSDSSRCVTHELWEGLSNTIHEYFDSRTLLDVCESKPKSSCKTYNSLQDFSSVTV